MASLFYDLVHKQCFTNQLLALPSKEIPQVLEKIELLRVSPQPDAKNKKRLHQYEKPIYRIRSGDYRILYTFGDGYVTLLSVGLRDTVYERHLAEQQLNSVAPPRIDPDEVLKPAPTWDYSVVVKEPDLLPEPVPEEELEPEPVAPEPGEPMPLLRVLDDALLAQLRISPEHWIELRDCTTLDDLIAANVPEEVRSIIFDVCATPDYDRVLQEPSFLADSADDYRRFLEGDLITFLLKLDPDQEKYVEWGIRGTGPSLLKGAPGTGKSIVAIYRARALIAALRKDGVAQPRILFTTYTNSLVASSCQLLERLLGEDARLIEVCTVDKLVSTILGLAGEPRRSVDEGIARAYIKSAQDKLANGSEQDQAFARSIASLSLDYLRAEIDSVIDGREHVALENYLSEHRAGRRVRLGASQRTAVWRIHQMRQQKLRDKGQRTFAQNRRRAAELVREGRYPDRYDGVIVDEAQDLDPTALRMLVGLCRSSDRLLLTADPNQSIYGSGFRWTDVHADLKFRGRTGVLKRNYRSTAEISLAGRSFLAGAELDEQEEAEIGMEHVRSGPRPVARWLKGVDAEIDHLIRHVQEATREYHVGLGSCAVLVPTNLAAEAMQRRLNDAGLRAAYMPGKAIDLQTPSVKILTLQSSKGLEFPIVALARLVDLPKLGAPNNATDEEVDEAIRRLRRVLYVAMTRAMHSLLVLLPEGNRSSLYQGFDERLWSITGSPSDQSELGVMG